MRNKIFTFCMVLLASVPIDMMGKEDEIVLEKVGITDNQPDTAKVYDVVEHMPQFVGGHAELMKFLINNIKYPVAAEEKGIQGRVVGSFVVECDGSITNIKIIKSVDPSLDEEAVRVLSLMPKWTPGTIDGVPVCVKYSVPVTFKLAAASANKPKTTSNTDNMLDTAKVYEKVEKMPQFVGGDAELIKFLQNNMRYPVAAEKNGIQGRVVCSFVVECNGSITNVKVVKSVDPLLDEEAVRVLSLMPKWTPGAKDGVPVRVKYTVPVTFMLTAGPANEPKMTSNTDNKPDTTKVYDAVEKMPQFVGGDAELRKFLHNNIKYPVAAEEKGIQGRVVCSFVVECDGSISNIKIIKSVDPSLDEEAVRVLSLMPKWTPGTIDGVPVCVKYTVPVTFRLAAVSKIDEFVNALIRVKEGGVVRQKPYIGTEPTSPNQTLQPTTSKQNQPSSVRETSLPSFPGGPDEMANFIANNLKYPKKAKKEGIEGRVSVSFFVEPSGTLSDITVNNFTNPLLEEEASRLVKSMPLWVPGKVKGMVVRQKFTVPITFSLDEENLKNDEKQEAITRKAFFPGGYEEMTKYLSNNLRYPASAKRRGIQGRVVVKFIVEKNGKLSNIKVDNSSHQVLEEEALRLVSEMPKWIPAMKDGEAITENKSVSVFFNLDDGKGD